MGSHHRRALLAAIALGVLIAMLGVGRAKAHSAVSAGPQWVPGPTDTWQYQLSSRIDTSVQADVFDVDAFTTTARTVSRLHELGHRAVCYVDAGSWEPYRPDADRYPASVIGKTVEGWPDERWLDIRRLDVLRPILGSRMDRCVRKGFDGVEFDRVELDALAESLPGLIRGQLRVVTG